jgi:hypothetical protein
MNGDRKSDGNVGEQPYAQHSESLEHAFMRSKPDGQRAGAGGW